MTDKNNIVLLANRDTSEASKLMPGAYHEWTNEPSTVDDILPVNVDASKAFKPMPGAHHERPEDEARNIDDTLIGSSFIKHALEEGYDEDFIRGVMCESMDHNVEEAVSGRSSTGVGEFSNHLKTFLKELLELSSVGERRAMLKQQINWLDIRTRVDMELISRLVQGFCFSACVSCVEDFRNDVFTNWLRGDTVETFIRFTRNEAAKIRPRNPKVLYFDDIHISRYPFDNALKTDTDVIAEIIDLRLKYADVKDETEKAKYQEELEGIRILSEAHRSVVDDVHWLEAKELLEASEDPEITSSVRSDGSAGGVQPEDREPTGDASGYE